MTRFQSDGSSYIEVDDSGGTPRDITRYIEEIELLGQEMGFLDVTGLSDTAQRVIAGAQLSQEFLLRGSFDDQATTGPDEVLSGIPGTIVTVSYGPAGNTSGQRQISGEFLCTRYQVTSRSGRLVSFVAEFKQDGPMTLGAWP